MELKLKTSFDDTELTEGWKSFIEETKKASGTWEEFNTKIKEGPKTIGKDLVQANNKAATSTKKFAREQKEANQTLAASAKSIKIFGVSVNDLKSKYDGLKKNASALNVSLKSTSKGMTASAKASKILGLAMKAIPIFLIVAAFASLVAVFTRTQKGMDFLSRGAAALGAIIGNVTDIAIANGKAIINTFKLVGNAVTFDFSAAKENFQDLKKNAETIAGEIKETFADVRRAINIEFASQTLRDAQQFLRRDIAETRKEIKKLNLISEDTTASLIDREKAAKDAGQKERELLKSRIFLEEQNIRLLKEKQSLTNDDENDVANNQAITEAIERRQGLELESLELQTTINNKLNTIRQEAIRKIEEEKQRVQDLQDAYQDLSDTLTEQLTEAYIESLDPIGKLNEQQKIAVLELENFRNALLTAADAAGKDADEIGRINAGVDTLVGKTNEEYQIKIDVLTTQAAGVDAFDPLATIEQSDALELPVSVVPALEGKKLLEGFKKTQFEILAEANDFTSDLEKIFGTDLSQSVGSFADLGAAVLDVVSAGFDAELAQIEETISARQEAIDTLESDLDREKELRDLGLANNYESTKAALKNETELLNQAEKEKDAIRKKQLKAQLAADLLAQGSALAVSAANTFKANSGIPFGVGLAIAATQILAMLATFRKFKTEVSSLYTGGRVSDALASKSSGMIAPMGKDDSSPMNRGKAYRVVDNEGQDMRVELGGKEFFVNQADSLDQKDFLEALNKGAFRGKDLFAMMAGSQMTDTSTIQIQSTGLQAKTDVIVNQQQLKIDKLESQLKGVNKKLDSLISLKENEEVTVFKPKDVEGELVNVKPSAFRTNGSAVRGRREV